MMMCRAAGLGGMGLFEGEGGVGWAEGTYWTSSEAGMSGVFSSELV